MAPGAILTEKDAVSPVIRTKASSTLGASKTDAVAALTAAQDRYVERNPTSLQLHQKAVNLLPGGNTRSLLHTDPFPLSMESGKGHQVFDEDGHTYTDFVGELTAGIYGHSHPVILKSITETINNIGLNLGATTGQEAAHAELMCSRFALERIRFTNSGTEANLHALAAARRFTGKRKIVVFSGGYHGAVLSFGGDAPAPNNVDLEDWIMAQYNNAQSACDAIRGKGVAAVLLEGMQGAGGCIPATAEFLDAVQDAAKDAGVLFILDEVMTSRLTPNGLAGLFNLKPDLKSFGKYLGGGIAFGAFGGRADIMAVYDPRNADALAHSGTFNNNTLAMHAGYAGLSQVMTPEVIKEFTALGEWLLEQLAQVTKGTKCCFTGRGTILAVHFSDAGQQSIKNREDIDERWDLKDLFWLEMMEAGYWITRRGSIAVILGTPKEELERFVSCVRGFLARHASLMKVAV